MRFARTLSLYVMRETLLYCTLTFVVLSLVLLTQNLLRRLDELFLVGMTLEDAAVVVRCLVPIALSYAIPFAFVIGMLLAIRRLSDDGELLAMRASGLGPNHFLLPCLALGVIATLMSSWLLGDVEHDARRELVKRFKQVAARGAIIEPGKFRYVGSHIVFVEDRERDGRLTGVMIYDQSRSDRRFRVFAAHGRLAFDADAGRLRLDLHDGEVHVDPRPDSPQRSERIRFEAFSYDLDVRHLLGMDFWPVRPKQMTLPELRAVIARAERGDPLRELDQKDPMAYALEIHRRRALPLASVLFAALAVPIALASEHRGRNLGLLVMLAITFAYYALGALGESLAESRRLPAGFASWLPNLVFATLALVLIQRGRNRIAA
jgi:lipopolysaccharide export system permease protein